MRLYIISVGQGSPTVKIRDWSLITGRGGGGLQNGRGGGARAKRGGAKSFSHDEGEAQKVLG